jgi:oligopeptide/dipeptide ABC transporter ATP-binding protein
VALSIRRLSVQYGLGARRVQALDEVDLDVPRGQILGVVGESGSGKSTLASSILRIVDPPGQITSGEILLGTVDLLKLDERAMRKFRGAKVALVPQNPSTSLNPTMTVGAHMIETIRQHSRTTRDDALRKSIAALERVHLSDAAALVKRYPHQLSGGIKQRVMIALALLGSPDVLIADEPTSALDATTQAQILRLVRELNEAYVMTVVFITHNLGVAAEICQHVAVMYAGRVVEVGDIYSLFERPGHPYTQGLMKAVPRADGSAFPTGIPGEPPQLHASPHGCAFAAGCERVTPDCTRRRPPAFLVAGTQKAYCFLYDKAAHAE